MVYFCELFQAGSRCFCLTESDTRLQPWLQGRQIYPLGDPDVYWILKSHSKVQHNFHEGSKPPPHPSNPPNLALPGAAGTGLRLVSLTEPPRPSNDERASEGGACLSLSWLAAGWNWGEWNTCPRSRTLTHQREKRNSEFGPVLFGFMSLAKMLKLKCCTILDQAINSISLSSPCLNS